MLFEREADVLSWYENQSRIVTPQFIASIPWKDVRAHPLDPKFVPILLYMRDIEMFTGVYYDELMRTPTWKDPVIRRFMDRWSTEEPTHAELLNRFLEEAGYPSVGDWAGHMRKTIPEKYYTDVTLRTRVLSLAGDHVSAVHMTWGAVNEYSTLTGYQRLWQSANHPVLTHILKAIAREEAMHSFFYWSVARIKLKASRFRRALTRFLVERFWAPVGSNVKPTDDTHMMITSLFNGEEGLRAVRQQINRKLEELPGFGGTTVVQDRIRTVLAKS